MKIIINLVIVAIIVIGAVYFYEQNRDEMNATLDNLKNTSVESVTEKVVDAVKNIDPDDFVKLVSDNKERIQEIIKNNNIDLENIDLNTLKDTLEDSGVDISQIDFTDSEVQQQIKELMKKTE